MTALEEKVLKAFKSYLRRSDLKGRYLAINLERIIGEWITLPVHREQYQIDGLMPHEAIQLQKRVASDFRNRWNKKSQETRQRKLESKRQTSFNFSGPQ